MRYSLQRLMATVSLVFCSGVVEARDLYGSYHQPDVDFSFVTDRARFDLNDSSDNTTITTEFTRFGVLVYNVPPDTLLHWGIFGGYGTFNQDSHNGIPALEFSGSYLGLSARVIIYESQRLSLYWTTNYSYISLSTNVAEQAVALTWNQLESTLQFGTYVSSQYELVMGVTYGRVENEQSESGIVDESHRLINTDDLGYELSLLYHTHKHDYVALRLKSGFAKGLGLQFQGTF